MEKYFIAFLLFSLCLSFSKADFDEEYAKKMVNFAAASFIGPQTRNHDKLAQQCFTKSFPDGNFTIVTQYSLKPCAGHYSDVCQLMIAKSEPLRMVVIAFQGTVGKDQMDNEAGASLQDYVDWYGLGKVNKYFYSASESTWYNHVDSALKNFKGYKFAFTGHSLGGAIAALTALKARVNGFVDDNKMTLYTFGEPRVGDKQLADTFRKQITEMYRVIHNSDLVPHMPLCSIPGFKVDSCKTKDGKPYHQPQEIWYNNNNLKMEDGDYKPCNENDGEDNTCSNSISLAVFLANFVSDRGADMHLHYYEHKLDEYGPAGCNSAVSLGLSLASLKEQQEFVEIP